MKIGSQISNFSYMRRSNMRSFLEFVFEHTPDNIRMVVALLLGVACAFLVFGALKGAIYFATMIFG